MFAGFALLTIVTMKLFPDVPVCRLLHRALVEAPLRRLMALSRQQLIFVLILLPLLFAASELIALLGTVDLVVLMAWDVSVYVDVVIGISTLVAVSRSRAPLQAFAGFVIRPFRSARRRAARHRIRATQRTANDSDDDRPAWACALAA